MYTPRELLADIKEVSGLFFDKEYRQRAGNALAGSLANAPTMADDIKFYWNWFVGPKIKKLAGHKVQGIEEKLGPGF